jgi:hypothetical protein
VEAACQVGRASYRYGAPVDPLLECYARESRVAAVTGADDANPLGIDDTLSGEEGDTVGKIGLHLAAPLAVASFGEGVVPIGRASVVRL